MLWTQSTTKDYIRTEHKLHLLYLQVIHFSNHCTTNLVFFNLFMFRWHSTRELSSGGPTPCASNSQHRKNRERFWKNAAEWTGRVEISKEEIPGSKCSMHSNGTKDWLIPIKTFHRNNGAPSLMSRVVSYKQRKQTGFIGMLEYTQIIVHSINST